MSEARTWVDWQGDPVLRRASIPSMDADTSDPKIRRLYGPKGEVLRTFSDRPPCGFHQGERA